MKGFLRFGWEQSIFYRDRSTARPAKGSPPAAACFSGIAALQGFESRSREARRTSRWRMRANLPSGRIWIKPAVSSSLVWCKRVAALTVRFAQTAEWHPLLPAPISLRT